MTRQREIIYHVIQTSCEHLTAEEIFLKAKQCHPSIAVGTVYRNLGLMAQQGEITRVVIPNAPDRYDKTCTQHDHLICERCGKMVDASFGDLKTVLQTQTDASITGYHLTLYYVCPACQQQQVC